MCGPVSREIAKDLGREGLIEVVEGICLGIDGGGTKTLAVVGIAEQGRVRELGQGQAGPSNPRAVGFDVAFSNIQLATRAALLSAGGEAWRIHSACLCLAGAGRTEEKEAVESWVLQSGLSERGILASEAEAVLAAVAVEQSFPAPLNGRRLNSGNSPTADNHAQVALIAGTGSLAWGRSSDQARSCRSGGWGYLLGDEGSGYWLGSQLLQRACLIADGRHARLDTLCGSVVSSGGPSGQGSDALQIMLEKLELNEPSQIVAWCYGSGDPRGRIASLAPLLLENAQADWAKDILRQGARHLAVMVEAVLKGLAADGYHLALAGGLFVGSQLYRERLMESLSLAPESLHVVARPALGALQLAALQLPSGLL
jgi:N-acetylglucosamine kinase-like BadF-type ATPase